MEEDLTLADSSVAWFMSSAIELPPDYRSTELRNEDGNKTGFHRRFARLSRIKSMFTSDDPLRASRPAWILVAASIAVMLLCQAAAAGEIKGKVVEAAGNTAKVSLDSIDAVKIGDSVEFFEFIAEIQDEAQVGTGVVAMIEAGKVTVTISQSSAKVAAGQQARVHTSVDRPAASVLVPQTRPSTPATTTSPESAPSTPDSQESGQGSMGVYCNRNFDVDPQRRRGTRVWLVFPGGAADAAGLRADDVLLKVGDESYEDSRSVLSEVSRMPVGEEVEVTFRRGDELFKTSLTFQKKVAAKEEMQRVAPLAEQGDPRASSVDGGGAV